MSRIGLIGAGYISRVHADVLAGLPGHHVSAVIDPNLDAAERLARSIGAPHALGSVEAALAAGVFDRAHVLVPPDLHAAIGGQILAGAIPVLLEKPLAATGAECAALLAAAQASGASLGVNQNFVHHPAFLRLQTAIADGRLGAVIAITCLYNVPLRQLAARQFGHWMFRRPGNLLLEQAVHPLSQILTLAGTARGVRMQPGRAIEIAPGLPFVGDFCAILDTPIPAQLRFAVGQSFPFWQMIVIGTDGVGVADILANRMYIHGRTRWMEPVDVALSGLVTAGGMAWSSLRNFAGYAAGMAKLAAPGDPFLRSMKGSIAAFHGALDAGRKPLLDGAFGAALVDLCETMADDLPVVRPRPTRVPSTEPAEVAILGGTGFIGTHVVRRFIAAGKHIVVMARSQRNLPEVFDSPLVRVESGDIGDAATVARVISGCQCVVNLAHGGGGGSFEAVRHAMVGGAETVARACREAGTRRLVHVGSIASLYLGPETAAITGRTPADQRETERGDPIVGVLVQRLLQLAIGLGDDGLDPAHRR